MIQKAIGLVYKSHFEQAKIIEKNMKCGMTSFRQHKNTIKINKLIFLGHDSTIVYE